MGEGAYGDDCCVPEVTIVIGYACRGVLPLQAIFFVKNGRVCKIDNEAKR